MKYLKLIGAFFMSLGALTLGGCSDDGVKNSFDYTQALPGRMDLTGAVSIGVKRYTGGNDSRAINGEYSSAGLYKVDAAGNISAVGVYFTTDKSGNRLEHEEYLRVVPLLICDLTDNYMIAFGCYYYDKDGEIIDDGYDDKKDCAIRRNVPYERLLVRKSDGKIWSVDNIFYSANNLGVFAEDSKGTLYRLYDGHVYKFNLDTYSPSYEQISKSPEFKLCSDLLVFDNGVYVSYRVDSHGTFGWPNSGFQKIEEAGTWPNFVYDGHLNKVGFDGNIGRRYNYGKNLFSLNGQFYAATGESVDVSVENQGVVFHSDKSIVDELNNEIGALGKYTVGDAPGSAKLEKINTLPISEMPSALKDHNNTESLYRDYFKYKYDIKSVFAGDGYALFSDKEDKSTLTLFDPVKGTWQWLGQLDMKIDFDRSIEYNNKVWNITNSPFGAKWFDLSTFETGSVQFDTTFPSFMYFNGYKVSSSGKVMWSGANPATGNTDKLVIDLTTGESVTTEIIPEMIFETLISLN